MTNQTNPADRLLYRRMRDEQKQAPFEVCAICGLGTDPKTQAPRHDGPAHEVWAYETHGMHAVMFPARPLVEGWAADPSTMPTQEEWTTLLREAADVEDGEDGEDA